MELLRVETGLTAPLGFLEDVFEIDRQVYSPELCGKLANLRSRYQKCQDSFLLIYDQNKLVGYLNLFPLSPEIFRELNSLEDHRMRDDDISADEVDIWRQDQLNHLFIISVALIPGYRKGHGVILLGNTLLDFLAEKERHGYKIGSISGSCTSREGRNFLKRFRAEYVKDVDGGYQYFIANRPEVETLLSEGLLLSRQSKGE